MIARHRGQLRLKDPELRRHDLAHVRAVVDALGVQHVTDSQIELFYELAIGDTELATNAIRDVAAGRVNTDLRRLRSLEDK